MTLNQWFKRKANFPFLLISLILITLYSAFLVHSFKEQKIHKIDSLKKLIVTTIVIGVQQNNLTLVESAISRAVDAIGVKNVFFCIDDDMIMTNTDIKRCDQIPNARWNESIINFPISGFKGHKIYFLFKDFEITKSIVLTLALSAILFCLLLWLIQKVKKDFIRDILNPIENNFVFSNNQSQILELKNIGEKIKQINESNAKAELSRQVAHDIKSPLTALNELISKSDNIQDFLKYSKVIKASILRINSIASDLLDKSKQQQSKLAHAADVSCLNSLVESLIDEKIIEYQNSGKVIFDLKTDSGFLFSKIDGLELKRVLSNLINNSIEAKTGDVCKISIHLFNDQSKNIISITDNGTGMSADLLFKLNSAEKVTAGKEFSKTSGSGIGVFTSHQLLKKYEGSLIFESTPNIGTTVKVELPSSNLQNLFLNEMIWPKSEKSIVVADDDESIFKLWEEKFRSLKVQNEIIFLNSTAELRSLLQSPHSSKIGLLLCDQRFANGNETGLDILKGIKGRWQSVLVTTQYDDIDLLKALNQLNMKIIPKVNISSLVVKSRDGEFWNSNIDAVLIDDDEEIIHSLWQLQADRHDKNLICFSNINKFMESEKDIDKDIPIYIDHQLGNSSPTGDIVAKKLNELGFKKLYLATGLPEGFESLTFLAGVTGKEPPWC